jgi:hypothetical protein
MLENLRLCDQRAEETVSAGESNGRLDNWLLVVMVSVSVSAHDEGRAEETA